LFFCCSQRGLWEQRQGFLTAAAKREQQHLAEAEAEVLRHVAKLVPEAEAPKILPAKPGRCWGSLEYNVRTSLWRQAMAELGRALRSQPAALPLVLVAGSWRRAVQHAFLGLARVVRV